METYDFSGPERYYINADRAMLAWMLARRPHHVAPMILPRVQRIRKLSLQLPNFRGDDCTFRCLLSLFD
jgi:hypothetical protein